jgi:serine/threonine-protein kinase/endoribonuclease IRE1
MRMKRLIDGAPSLMDMVWETETEGPPGDGLSEQPDEIDAITAARKRRENAMKKLDYGSEDDRCQDRNSLYTDRSCLVGIRPLAEGDGDGPEMRLKRLIDGVPYDHLPR